MALYKGSIRLAGIGSFPDQIQYMSQDDYNALSEEAKMNGTSYGIIEDGSNALTSDMINSIYGVFTGIGKSTSSLSTDGSWRFPANTNIIHVQGYIQSGGYYSGVVSLFFAKGLPTFQYVGYGSYSSSYAGLMRFTVDRGNLTITASSYTGAYPTISVTVTAF